MTPPATPTVLVLAVGGNVSQGILKALARGTRPCRVIGADIGALQMGLYTVDRAYVSPWASDPNFLPWLMDCCSRESVDLILSGAEPVLMVLARRRAEIEQKTGACCPVSEFEVMETCDDKWQTCRWLSEHGFPCPPYAAADDAEAVDQLLKQHGFPLIAKPRRGGGSRGHFPVTDAADLSYARKKAHYLLQASIGAPGEEYTVGCFVTGAGKLTASCCIRRELTAGTTVRAQLGDFPAVREAAERIVAELQPLGPCNVQLRVVNGEPMCLEINPRFSGTAPIRAHYGYNEAAAVVEHFLYGAPPNLPLVTSGIALRYWNELYVDPEAASLLESTGRLEEPHHHPTEIETYGLRD